MIMEKNWLIRTKSNHILGPVSREKVLELYQNGSIKPDDELCTGNGFWFFAREEDMVDRYLVGKEVQGFNPISEAKDVLTSHSPSAPEESRTDITRIGTINTSLLSKEDRTPPATVMSSLTGEAPVESVPEKKKSEAVTVAPQKITTKKKKIRKQSYIQYIGVLCFIALLLLVYFRKSIIRNLFKGEVTVISVLLPTAHAQEEIPEKKKSSLNAR